MTTLHYSLILLVLVASVLPAWGQPLGQPDRNEPGDAMIQAYLQRTALKLSAKFSDDVQSLKDWKAKRPQYLEEYYYMLGLSPQPEKSPLKATVTGKVHGEGYVVENLHYQSRPGLYVTGNMYRPAEVKEGERLPAVFYVCGHAGRGRNGNKVAFQSHGIWFARHGYVCLIADTLQLGEIAAIHHGTYNLQRWWWHSRGYTPAGVEAWNGIRGIDYLVDRADVDPERIAVTGISGGGAATFWIAAADERVKLAVPVSGMADLEAYVPNRVINGHCDCMFMVNTFQWPWTRIAGLVAPRPMLFVNSDDDAIFPMDANERISNRLERLYSLYGAGDRFDAVVSVGGHAYRDDIRQAEYRFLNSHFKGDARPVPDGEIDVVSEGGNPGPAPIPPERLRVFVTEADLPADQLNTKIDEHFVPLAEVAALQPGKFEEWKKPLLAELKRVSFGYFPEQIPAAKSPQGDGASGGAGSALETEDSITIHASSSAAWNPDGKRLAIVVINELKQKENKESPKDLDKTWKQRLGDDCELLYCEPRGIGATKWTRKNGPNFVERSHVLLGRTVDAGRVWDVIATARHFAERYPKFKIEVAGEGAGGVIAAYAAIVDDSIAGVTLVDPPTTHMESTAPQFLNVLRVCDVPDSLGLIAPRPLAILGTSADEFQRTSTAYAAAGAKDQLKLSKP